MNFAKLVGAVILMGGCASTPEGGAGPATTPPVEQPVTCTMARPEEVEAVSRALIEGYTIEGAEVLAVPGVGKVVVANIEMEGERVSSQDTWLIDAATALPLSSSAEDYSTSAAPPGRSGLAGDAATAYSRC